MFPKAFVLIDALDECSVVDGSQRQFLSEIFRLQKTTGASLFATSRCNMEITEMFSEAVCLKIHAHAGDLQAYLADRMCQLRACVLESLDLQKKIMEKIIEAVDGMQVYPPSHTVCAKLI
jgi:hypothetical protein